VIYCDDGLRGLYRGTLPALVGVSYGALQFMTYEKMKSWAFECKRWRIAKLVHEWTTDDDKLVRSNPLKGSRGFSFLMARVFVNFEYIVQRGLYVYVWHVRASSTVRNISIPSHPLTYPGVTFDPCTYFFLEKQSDRKINFTKE
jgi:Mitochondrial carrier protein